MCIVVMVSPLSILLVVCSSPPSPYLPPHLPSPHPQPKSYTNPPPQGVSGTGKSTLGTALAQSLSLPYIEGDDLHPPSNIAKMSSGTPLNDEDREPWLRLIRRRVEEYVKGQLGEEGRAEREAAERRGRGEGKEVEREGEEERKLKGVVVGCSSLKRYYRDILRGHLNPTKPSQSEAAHTPPPESLRQASPASLAAFADAVTAAQPVHSSPLAHTPITSSSTPSSSAPSSSAPQSQSHPPSANGADIPTYFVFITGPPSLLYSRMEARPGHFMKASMLDSQLATLEDPTQTGEEGVVSVSIEDGTEVQVQRAREGLRGLGVGV